MKIPICPRCKQPHTLKLTDNFTVRCYRAHGGCGELFTLHAFAAHDSSGVLAELYREEEKPPLEWTGNTLFRMEDTKRVLVGHIVQKGPEWEVWVKRTLRQYKTTEESARQELEKYGKDRA